MARPCAALHAPSPKTCRLCHWCTDGGAEGRAYRAVWGEPEPAAGPAPACIHLGVVLAGDVHECGLFKACTVSTAMAGLPDCRTCEHFRPDNFHMIAPGGAAGAMRWEGNSPKRPWHYRVTVLIPHLNTPEVLEAALPLWQLQDEAPYVVVVDTGSDTRVCDRLERLRTDNVEIHYIRGHGYTNSSGPVACAQDLGMAMCRTERMLCTHSDVFPRRRDLLTWMAAQCDKACPVVGYEMSPRDWVTKDWRGMVGHTATMLHMPAMRYAGAIWNMEHAYALAGWTGKAANGWPDTEVGFNLILRHAGIVPKLIGHDQNLQRLCDDNIDHSRSYTGALVYSPGWLAHAEPSMQAALREAKMREQAWRDNKG